MKIEASKLIIIDAVGTKLSVTTFNELAEDESQHLRNIIAMVFPREKGNSRDSLDNESALGGKNSASE